MSSNCAGVVSRPSVVTGIVSCVPAGDGSRPRRPAGFVVFCSCTAAITSSTVMPRRAIFSGLSWSRMEKFSPAKAVALPTPGTRFSSSVTYRFM